MIHRRSPVTTSGIGNPKGLKRSPANGTSATMSELMSELMSGS
jgi:hypothetical protein